ncbi:MAG: transcriptional repressor LexA [Rhodocyclaceae bacterium]|nr:transcriptional repressor LexA [Rhodocyclaceae bacterium]
MARQNDSFRAFSGASSDGSGRQLTARQAEILALIRSSIQEDGMPPTRAEIARALGFSSVTAAVDHLKALAKKGLIELLPGSSRGIRLVEALEPGLPLIGRVAAGSPILAQEHIVGRYPVDMSLFSPRADYLLTVRGLSMRDAGILDGDWLAVHRTPQARSGQIVVARLDEEVTVKRLRLLPGRAELLPENPDFKPIVVDLERQPLVIEGLAVGVIRRMEDGK